MRFRQSLMKYTQKFGVTQASRRFNKRKSHIYFWLKRHDGSIESLARQSRRSHSHPNTHTEVELKLIRDMAIGIPILASWNSGTGCGCAVIPAAWNRSAESCANSHVSSQKGKEGVRSQTVSVNDASGRANSVRRQGRPSRLYRRP